MCEFHKIFFILILLNRKISFRHILIGPAFGLTNTVVPFPSLSNILFNIPGDPPTEICDASKLFWSKFKENIYVINRTLNGFDGLLTNKK